MKISLARRTIAEVFRNRVPGCGGNRVWNNGRPSFRGELRSGFIRKHDSDRHRTRRVDFDVGPFSGARLNPAVTIMDALSHSLDVSVIRSQAFDLWTFPGLF